MPLINIGVFKKFDWIGPSKRYAFEMLSLKTYRSQFFQQKYWPTCNFIPSKLFQSKGVRLAEVFAPLQSKKGKAHQGG